eukprot:10410457-Alexandrium_andersonii.AAC.1
MCIRDRSRAEDRFQDSGVFPNPVVVRPACREQRALARATGLRAGAPASHGSGGAPALERCPA